MIHLGIKAVIGTPPQQKPVLGLPPGRAKLIFRKNACARLYLRTTESIREFILIDRVFFWEPLEQNANYTLANVTL